MKGFMKVFLTLLVFVFLSGFTSASATTVSIVRSDYSGLKNPVSPKTELSREQIEQIVRKAVDLLGGMKAFVKPTDKWVVIKPNIVELTRRGNGDITDSYVVWAIAKIVYEVAPKARITIAEASGGWMSPGHPDIEKIAWGQVADGFETAGFRDILKDPALQGANVDIVDMNYDPAVELKVQSEPKARDNYFFAKTVVDCDVLIDVPVLKLTNSIGFTGAMKNYVGILPGTKYGWAKNTGFPPGSPNLLPHSDTVYDEMIADLTSLAKTKLTIMDAILGVEKGRVVADGGRSVRMNTIIAGADPVAVDAVSARMVGLNPDDFEFITLAQMRKIGVGDLSQITLKGKPLDQVGIRYEKKSLKNDPRSHYGQSNRTWIFKGPFKLSDKEKLKLDPKKINPMVGRDGWSQPVYFGDDMLDLSKHFIQPSDCLVYAYTDFIAPKTQDAELWLGSDEGMTVWLNGETVYNVTGSRRHKLPNDIQKVHINQGKNTLLLELVQTSGKFDFSLNVCDVEPNIRYNGNRVLGLKFVIPGPVDVKPAIVAAVAELEHPTGLEAVVNEVAGVDPMAVPKEKKKIAEFPKMVQYPADYLSALQSVLEYKGEKVSLSYLMGITGEAFKLYRMSDSQNRWFTTILTDEVLATACKSLGYSYAYSYNTKSETAAKMLNGWLDRGYPVMVVTRIQQRAPRSWCVVTSCDTAAKEATLRTPMDKDNAYTKIVDLIGQWRGSWPGPVTDRVMFPMFVVGEKVKASSSKETIITSLKKAVELARKDTVTLESDYEGETVINSGFSAYENWVQNLNEFINRVPPDTLSMDEKGRFLFVTSMVTDNLWASRKAASEYLLSIGSADKGRSPFNLSSKDQQDIIAVSKLYSEVAGHLERAQSLLPKIVIGGPRRGDLPPEEITRTAGNSPAVRDAIQAAYTSEKLAIEKLEKVVSLLVSL